MQNHPCPEQRNSRKELLTRLTPERTPEPTRPLCNPQPTPYFIPPNLLPPLFVIGALDSNSLELDVILELETTLVVCPPRLKLSGSAFTAAQAVPLPEAASYPIQLITPEEESWTRADVDAAYVAEESLIVGPVKGFC